MNLSLEFHPVPKPVKQARTSTNTLARKQPMSKKQSKKARSKEFPAWVKQAVRERSGNRCERCKKRPLMEFHHCHFRSEGSACTNELANAIGLCIWCHRESPDSAHKSAKTRRWCIAYAAEQAALYLMQGR